MMFTSKKITATIMLLGVAAPLLFFAGFLIKQSLIQHEMEEKMETASLQTISMDIADFHWQKLNKEALVDGKLFDVRSYSIAGNKIILTGLFDNDENELHDQLKNFLQQKNNPNTPLNSTVVKFLFPPLYTTIADTADQKVWHQLSNHLFAYNNENAIEKYLSSETPPPRFI